MRRRTLVIGGLAAAPFIRAGADGLAFAAKAAAARRRGEALAPDVPTPSPTLGLAAAVALDRLVTQPMTALATVASPRHHYERSSAELDDAIRFYEQAGWLDDSTGYHATPTQVADLQAAPTGRTGHDPETLRFESGWQPHDGEVGADRWRGFEANAVVPVTVLRHPGGPRPWLVAVHGQGMGHERDVRFLRVRRLHEELGVNIALPVLSLHGARACGIGADAQFVSNVYPVNNVFGLSQAMWDLRRLLLWLRDDQAATEIGVLGFSLGSLAAGLLSTLEGELACVIAVVPAGDLYAPLRDAEPLGASKKALHRRVHDRRSEQVHKLVSPLERACLVPHERRYIVAGQGDQIAPPAGTAMLWRHWGEPAIEWRPRGHLTTGASSIYDAHLDSILTASGLRVA